MRWLLLSCEEDFIVKQCGDLLEVAGQTVICDHYHGKSSIQEIKEKIDNERPDRIIIIVNHNASSALCQLINHTLVIPLYVVQATANSYSPIPVLLLTCSTNDHDCLSIIQNATNQLINIYPNIVRHVKSILIN